MVKKPVKPVSKPEAAKKADSKAAAASSATTPARPDRTTPPKAKPAKAPPVSIAPAAAASGSTSAESRPSTASEPSPAAPANKPSQAVVIVHGMGEQRPMDTIRSFVKAVWSSDLSLTGEAKYKQKPDPDDAGKQINKSWIHFDDRAKSYELRVITTPRDIHGRRTDFYELYWSDITQGTTVQRLTAWVKGLLLRRPRDVPRDAMRLYAAAWIVTLAILAALFVPNLMKWFEWKDFLMPSWAWTAAGLVAGALITGFLVPYFGDVAIYVRAEPGTIAKRTEVRNRGLDLLRGLTDDPSYDRIVLVAHSLGTIVAYDLLQLLWSEYAPSPVNDRSDEPELRKALRAVGKKAIPIESVQRAAHRMTPDELAEFQGLQWKLYTQLRHAPIGKRPWKISDFVTCGSPLTHAEFLVTHNASELVKAVDERLLATCPPVSETQDPSILYPLKKPKYPHQAAVFAATRWTNVFDKGNGWSTGDPISGPMQENFGPGVENIQVKLRWGLGRIFTHTQYWSLDAVGEQILPSGKPGGRSHVDVLHHAVDLGRRFEPGTPPGPSGDVARGQPTA